LVMNNYVMGLDNHTAYKDVVSKLTPMDISKFVKDYLSSSNKVSIIMLPKE